ncbi:MAG: phospholipase D-like domain-containing protein [Candidatus Shapirobacteria bacterium]|jgi:phosphatidylserine/phosphatidylglycerophosphate/cardiolipin synthase-like enzyme|nr:phospholipase D-like domain-containing protein [Candidatus Shapirobacteria bacterium]
MFNLFNKPNNQDILKSKLYDENTFYHQFIKDLENSQKEVIIESPFITTARMDILAPIFTRLVKRGVKIYVKTRDPKEHTETYEQQSEAEIHNFEVIGIQALICTGNHHRKLAIIDRNILWEGSLNILSQTKSREIMRRMESQVLAMEMYNFLNYKKFL